MVSVHKCTCYTACMVQQETHVCSYFLGTSCPKDKSCSGCMLNKVVGIDIQYSQKQWANVRVQVVFGNAHSYAKHTAQNLSTACIPGWSPLQLQPWLVVWGPSHSAAAPAEQSSRPCPAVATGCGAAPRCPPGLYCPERLSRTCSAAAE